jgi:[acyl-carrier-protein] S-malonyltransferase
VSLKTAYLFPGQASQSVGMGKDLYDRFEVAREVFEEGDAALGFGLSKLCFEGPLEELTETRNAQPAILLHSMAVHAVLSEAGFPTPVAVAGHSLGEFSAAAAAGALGRTEALRAVRRRGELMFEAGTQVPGTMAAVVGLDAPAIREVCDAVSQRGVGVVVLANLNSESQLVISGDVAAVEAAAEPLKEAGARRVIPLNVSGAFHSPLMECVQDEFAEFLASLEFHAPRCPVVTNVEAEAVADAERLRRGFVAQLVSPVRWHESVAHLVEDGVEHFVEVGPGSVLSTLGSRAHREVRFSPTSSVEGIEKLLASAAGTG